LAIRIPVHDDGAPRYQSLIILKKNDWPKNGLLRNVDWTLLGLFEFGRAVLRHSLSGRAYYALRIFFENLKKRICLNVRLICIETGERKNREDPSTLT
jgi:hypothetical protein